MRNLPEGEGRWEKEIREEGLESERDDGVKNLREERVGRIEEEEAMGTTLTNTIGVTLVLWMSEGRITTNCKMI